MNTDHEARGVLTRSAFSLRECDADVGGFGGANGSRQTKQQRLAPLGGRGVDAEADGGGEGVLAELVRQGLPRTGPGVGQ